MSTTTNSSVLEQEQQTQLASQLWELSFAPRPQPESDDALVEPTTLQTKTKNQIVTLLNKPSVQASLATWKGIQVGWLLNIFCKTPYIQTLLEYDNCELWFFRKACIPELICQAVSLSNQTTEDDKTTTTASVLGSFVDYLKEIRVALGLENGTTTNNDDEIVQPATTFVSYTGSCSLKNALEFLGQLDPKEYIWMDVFCMNQFALAGFWERPEQKHQQDMLLTELQGQIQSAHKTVLLVEQWNDMPTMLQRIWVFFGKSFKRSILKRRSNLSCQLTRPKTFAAIASSAMSILKPFWPP